MHSLFLIIDMKVLQTMKIKTIFKKNNLNVFAYLLFLQRAISMNESKGRYKINY